MRKTSRSPLFNGGGGSTQALQNLLSPDSLGHCGEPGSRRIRERRAAQNADVVGKLDSRNLTRWVYSTGHRV